MASVSRRFSLCLPVSRGLCLCDSPAGGDHAAVQHDPLTDGGGWHVFLAAWGRGWIGKVSCGCDRSMRWLLRWRAAFGMGLVSIAAAGCMPFRSANATTFNFVDTDKDIKFNYVMDSEIMD